MAHLSLQPRFHPPLALAAVLALSACVGPQAGLARHLAQASHTQAAARAAHADSVPEAAVHLELADKQLALAQKAAEEGEVARAHRLIDCAEADALLAIAMAQEGPANARAQEHADQAQSVVVQDVDALPGATDRGSATDVYLEGPTDDNGRSGWAHQPGAMDDNVPDPVGLPLDRSE